jgi:hypothetical protein
MPLPCSACHHPDRERLDRELAHAVKPRSALAKEYGISSSSLARHIVHSRSAAGIILGGRGTPKPNSPGFAAQVHAGIAQMLSGASLAQEVSRLRERAEQIARDAEGDAEGKGKDPRVGLLAIRELTRLVELQGRMMLEASQGRASDVSAHPVWMTLSGLIMQAIGPCDSCRAKVSAVIRDRLGIVPAQAVSQPSDVPFP